MDLVDFLLARLYEDEAAARKVAGVWRQIGETGVIVTSDGDRAEECANGNWTGIAEHIVRHDPARVLAEVNAKRRLIRDWEIASRSLASAGTSGTPYDLMTGATNTLGRVLRLLGLPYADHPDYRDEWRPQ